MPTASEAPENQGSFVGAVDPEAQQARDKQAAEKAKAARRLELEANLRKAQAKCQAAEGGFRAETAGTGVQMDIVMTKLNFLIVSLFGGGDENSLEILEWDIKWMEYLTDKFLQARDEARSYKLVANTKPGLLLPNQ